MTKIQHISRKRRIISFERLESRCMLSAAGLATQEATVFAHIPQDLSGRPGQEVIAPVQIDDAAGIRGAEIRISYDTNLLDTSNLQVRAGSVWPDTNTEVVANVDDAAGTIIVWVFHPEALPSGSGSLLDVHFAIRDDAAPGTTTALDFTRLRLNEGLIVPTPEPIEGPDPTDGRISIVAIGGTASVSGFVYADTNTNDQPDEFEGIPLVTITLVDLNSGETWQDVTDDDGRYDFTDLAAGSYEIRQTQPAAFLDGGPNTISINLSAGQQLANQNFRELGLRPEYVYSRLFTTVVMPIGSVAWRSLIREIVKDAEQDAAAAQTAIAAQTVDSDASAAVSAESAAAAIPPGGEGESVTHTAYSAIASEILPAPAVAAAAAMLAAPVVPAPIDGNAGGSTEDRSAEAPAADLQADGTADSVGVAEADRLAAAEGEASEAVWTAVWTVDVPAAELPAAIAGVALTEVAGLAEGSAAPTGTLLFAAPAETSDPGAGLEMQLVSVAGVPTPGAEDIPDDNTAYTSPSTPADQMSAVAVKLAGADDESLSGQEADLLFATDDLALL